MMDLLMSKSQEFTKSADVIRKRRQKLHTRNGYISLFIRLIIVGVIGYVLLTQVFLVTRASGNDMFPAIKDGDLVIAFRIQKDYVKDDIVAYENGELFHLGRVVARETDVVTLDETGILLVNGTVQKGEIVYPTLAKEGYTYPMRIEEGDLFLLGDHRMESKDSRDFGPIGLNQVKGKVITILRRRGL